MTRASKLVEALLAFLLLAMVVMVFGNVVLRYVFNSGIVVSEELSRFCFIWLTFIGAVLAMREGKHLGMDSVVRALSRRGRLICFTLSQAMVLGCCAMLVWGTWVQHDINATMAAPVTGLSMIWVYGATYVSGIGIGLHALTKLWRVATGQIRNDELIDVSESEEVVHAPVAKEASP